MQFVQVCVNTNVKSLDRVFTYKLPDTLAHIEIGYRVIVPFGKAIKEGIVLEKSPNLEIDIEQEKIKFVLDVVDKQAWFS